ncbi:palmitoyl acyltransferase 10 [Novymonas esmeraldas]|uniref:Palmitoyltransferase n=1 Tax=Novymonas esmeraldas TaxID=1808958 RepID=A0AAW0EZD8_9TRYP
MPISAAPPLRSGNIRVFLNGYIHVGPDWRIMAVSVVLIAACASLFVFFTNEVLAARIIVGVTALLSVATLLLCGLSDPGVKPRQPPPPTDAPLRESHWRERVYVDRAGQLHRARHEMKWCYSCNVHRPYRGVHCRYCDRCVSRRDHHCPWTGTCIGAKNYRSYFALVWVLSIMLGAALVGGLQSLAQRIVRHTKSPSVIEDGPSAFTAALVDTYCLELLLILFSFVFGLLAWSLAVYHTYLVSQNLTSGDAAKDMDENVFTHGSVAANFWAALTGWRGEEDEEGPRHADTHAEVVIESVDYDDAGHAPSVSPASNAEAASQVTLRHDCVE